MDILQKVMAEKKTAFNVYHKAKNITDIKKSYATFDKLCKEYHYLWIEKKVSFQEKTVVCMHAEFLSAVISTYFYTLKRWEGKKIMHRQYEQKIREMIMSLKLAKKIYYGDVFHKSLIDHTPFMSNFLKKLEFTIIDYRKRLNESING